MFLPVGPDHDDRIPTVFCSRGPPIVPSKSTVSSTVAQSKKSSYVPSRKCYQTDLLGKWVPTGTLKIKVKSYNKRNRISVAKYCRKKGGPCVALKTASTPRICFKRLRRVSVNPIPSILKRSGQGLY